MHELRRRLPFLMKEALWGDVSVRYAGCIHTVIKIYINFFLKCLVIIIFTIACS
jgi:hypothetical protein